LYEIRFSEFHLLVTPGSMKVTSGFTSSITGSGIVFEKCAKSKPSAAFSFDFHRHALACILYGSKVAGCMGTSLRATV
jgi:hypothetical protein